MNGPAVAATCGVITQTIVRVAVVAAILAAGACGGGGDGGTTPPLPPSPPSTGVARVAITGAPGTVEVGQSASLTATPYDAGNVAVVGLPVAWSVAPDTVASVDVAGVVVGRRPGTAIVTATAGGRAGTASVTVVLAPVATIAASLGAATLFVGETTQAATLLHDARQVPLTGRTVTWATSDAAVATVRGDGLVTAVGPGTVQLTATAEGKSATTPPLTVRAVPAPASVRIAGAPGPLALNDTLAGSVAATVTDQFGTVLTVLPAGYTLQWTSSAPTHAAIAAGEGLAATVTGQRGGRATITAAVVRTGAAEPVARDTLGVTVQATPAALALVSSAVASAPVATALAAPVTVRVQDRHGDPVAGVIVRFVVAAPAAAPGRVSAAEVTSDAMGLARTEWTLAQVVADNELRATLAVRPSVAGISVAVRGVAGPPARVTVTSSGPRLGLAGYTLPDTLTAVVTDAYGNRIAGQPVTWVPPAGGETAALEATTRVDGSARAHVQLGSAEGAQEAVARAAGSEGRVGFTAATYRSLVIDGSAPVSVAQVSTVVPRLYGTVNGAIVEILDIPLEVYGGGTWITEPIDAGASPSRQPVASNKPSLSRTPSPASISPRALRVGGNSRYRSGRAMRIRGVSQGQTTGAISVEEIVESASPILVFVTYAINDPIVSVALFRGAAKLAPDTILTLVPGDTLTLQVAAFSGSDGTGMRLPNSWPGGGRTFSWGGAGTGLTRTVLGDVLATKAIGPVGTEDEVRVCSRVPFSPDACAFVRIRVVTP